MLPFTYSSPVPPHGLVRLKLNFRSVRPCGRSLYHLQHTLGTGFGWKVVRPLRFIRVGQADDHLVGIKLIDSPTVLPLRCADLDPLRILGGFNSEHFRALSAVCGSPEDDRVFNNLYTSSRWKYFANVFLCNHLSVFNKVRHIPVPLELPEFRVLVLPLQLGPTSSERLSCAESCSHEVRNYLEDALCLVSLPFGCYLTSLRDSRKNL